MKKISCQKKLYAFIAYLLICLSQLFIAPSTIAETILMPDATVSNFYVWYLHSLAADQDPLHDDKKKISMYVSKALLNEIEKKMNSANGLDADYFIQAQDYLNDWESNISVTKPVIHGSTAKVIVTLGATKESVRRLTITVNKENSIWKIRKVQVLQDYEKSHK